MDPRNRQYPTEVENYTNAFLVSFGVIIFMVLFAIWAVLGLIFAGLFSAIADRLMTIDFKGRRASNR